MTGGTKTLEEPKGESMTECRRAWEFDPKPNRDSGSRKEIMYRARLLNIAGIGPCRNEDPNVGVTDQSHQAAAGTEKLRSARASIGFGRLGMASRRAPFGALAPLELAVRGPKVRAIVPARFEWRAHPNRGCPFRDRLIFVRRAQSPGLSSLPPSL